MSDNDAAATRTMDSQPPAKRLKFDDDDDDDEVEADDVPRQPDGVVAFYEQGLKSLLKGDPEMDQATKDRVAEAKIIVAELKDSYSAEDKYWTWKIFGCFPFSPQLVKLVRKNVRFQIRLHAYDEISSELIFPDGAGYLDWLERPRRSFLQKGDWRKGVFGSAYEIYQMVLEDLFQQMWAVETGDPSNDLYEEENYDHIVWQLAELYIHSTPEELIRYEQERVRESIYIRIDESVEEDIWKLQHIKRYFQGILKEIRDVDGMSDADLKDSQTSPTPGDEADEDHAPFAPYTAQAGDIVDDDDDWEGELSYV